MNVSIIRSFSAFTKTLTVCYTPEMDAGQFFFSQPNPWMIPTQLNPTHRWTQPNPTPNPTQLNLTQLNATHRWT